MLYMSEDDDFSGCLIPSMNFHPRRFAELNFSNPSSNELNIFDSLDLKFKTRPFFFRQLTKSQCEISNEDEKYLSDRIISFFKRNRNGNGDKDKDKECKDMGKERNRDRDEKNREKDSLYPNPLSFNNYLCLSITEEDKFTPPLNSQIQINNPIDVVNIKEKKLEDSEISEGTFEKMLNSQNENGSEIRIFQKNKQRFSNLNTVRKLYIKINYFFC
jgi:hypothetical protein